jgi:tRNA nucleotidyltransferase (CCA-adding enzyme)
MNNKLFWRKLVLAESPGNFIFSAEVLNTDKWPEFYQMHKVPQDPEDHPEGDVAAHTCHVTNYAAFIARRECLDEISTIILVLSALLHDIAKPPTFKRVNSRITFKDHEKIGAPMAEAFLIKKGFDQDIIENIVPLIRNHAVHYIFNESNINDKAMTGLLQDLYPSDIKMLSYLIESDSSGRPPIPVGLPITMLPILKAVENLDMA